MTAPNFNVPRHIQMTIVSLGLCIAVLGAALLEITITARNQSKVIKDLVTVVNELKNPHPSPTGSPHG